MVIANHHVDVTVVVEVAESRASARVFVTDAQRALEAASAGVHQQQVVQACGGDRAGPEIGNRPVGDKEVQVAVVVEVKRAGAESCERQAAGCDS